MRILLSYVLAAGIVVAFSNVPASARTAKACNAEYLAKSADLKAAGTKKSDFIVSCRAETDAAIAVPVNEVNPYQAQYLMERRVCPPDTHSRTSAVSGNGYECIVN